MTTPETTVFSTTTEDTTVVTTPPTTPTIPPEVAELVGQGKKYATVDEALKSVPHAQNHIQTLKEELDAMKTELEKRKTAEQLLDEIKSGMQATETPPVSSITPDTVAQMVEQTLSRQTKAQLEKQNISQVTGAFSEKFGEKAEEVYIAIANESGLSVEQLNLLSATSPSAVLKLAGLTEKKQVPIGKLDSSVNTEALATTDTTESLSSKIKPGASTKDLVNAWKIAGQKIGKQS